MTPPLDSPSPTLQPVEALSFEQAMAELESLVRKLEGGQTPLAEAMAAYERGTLLKKHCAQHLRAAQLKVEMVVLDPDAPMDAVGTVPFEERP